MASIIQREESLAFLKAACTELGFDDIPMKLKKLLVDARTQSGKPDASDKDTRSYIYRSLDMFLARENGIGDGSSLIYPPVVVDVIRHLYPDDIKDYAPKSKKRRNFYEVPLRELLEVYREGDLREEFTHPRENPDSSAEIKKKKL